MKQIKPHGGELINRVVSGNEREELQSKAPSLPQIALNEREISDLDMIACGAVSPITGFMDQSNFESVLDHKCLVGGTPWTLPITLSVDSEKAKELNEGQEIALTDLNGQVLATLKIKEIYTHRKEKESLEIYGTTDIRHPGVDYVYNKMKNVLIGGDVKVINRVQYDVFNERRKDPVETRKIFQEKGWRRTVAYQTRNPIHRAHEFLMKCAMEICDGLLIHPLMGETKSDDVPAKIRMDVYEYMLKDYYPHDRVELTVFPAAMRYAGPREAVFHALIRKNYGCTHFIVGRDHAGVAVDGKPAYGSFDAHYIFDEFDPADIGIMPLFFDFTFYCKACDGMASFKTCPHDASEHIAISGTKVRELLRKGDAPPPEITRPGVAKILIKAMQDQANYSI